ncbi:unnamed protein product [Paramecium sonneborni]|uniref:Association with the SNF1 complex (ASC) domain-containing protein n=1 Tax=Paramecium sonneborni TaxID=65129 RepID=A0A8S1KUS3_9CILI|nr:unnamed protein product [Paramecium sonneborni]
MGSQSSKLVTETQRHEHAINYMNSGGSMSDKSAKSIKDIEQTQQEFVNTQFKWNFGGQKVFVAGTFSQWKTTHQLQRDKGGEFSIVIPLPKGIHHYKFIVDGDWRFSPDDPTTADEHGNINNVIDTTKVENKAKEFMESSQQFKPEKSPNDSIIQNQKQVIQDFNFNDKAPPVPPHLLKYYYIEEKEKKLNNMWNKDIRPQGQMELEDAKPSISQQEIFDHLIQIFSNVNSLSPPPHVNLNHLACLTTNKNSPFSVYALTHRFKAKHTTIKFYTHKYQENKQQLFVV